MNCKSFEVLQSYHNASQESHIQGHISFTTISVFGLWIANVRWTQVIDATPGVPITIVVAAGKFFDPTRLSVPPTYQPHDIWKELQSDELLWHIWVANSRLGAVMTTWTLVTVYPLLENGNKSMSLSPEPVFDSAHQITTASHNRINFVPRRSCKFHLQGHYINFKLKFLKWHIILDSILSFNYTIFLSYCKEFHLSLIPVVKDLIRQKGTLVPTSFPGHMHPNHNDHWLQKTIWPPKTICNFYF